MSKRKKIAIFTTDLYKGGVAESTRKLVETLSSRYEIDLIVYDNTPISFKTKHDRIINLNLPLSANFAKSRVGVLLKKIFRWPSVFLAILYLIYYRIKYKPEIIYSMTYVPNVVNICSSFFYKGSVKTIISERQDPRMDLKESKLMATILKLTYKFSDRIHANSKEMVSAISDFYSIPKRKIYYLDNFFYLNEIKERSLDDIEENMKPIFDKKVIITSGRLSKQKGQWFLIDALHQLSSVYDDYYLVVLGDGELKDFLSERAIELGIHDKVYFLGNVSNPHKYVGASHVFLFPSLWESFGNSIVEAMALSIPIISTECKSGPGYIIGNGEYGLSIGILPDALSGYSSSYAKKIASKIEYLRSESVYEEYSTKSLIRSKDFDAVLLENKIFNLFKF
nr:glycosyltransferase [Pseudoalteromonas sp. TB13]